MSNINHIALSQIFGSEIVGHFETGHGQINSLRDGDRYFDVMAQNQPPSVFYRNETANIDLVLQSFIEVRDAIGDRGSPDLYVAEPHNNRLFLEQCRKNKLDASDYTLNKQLLNARKNGHLPDLNSAKTHIDYDGIAFSVEYAATELKYRTGASTDDILCDPTLSRQFDSIARSISPGRTVFDYRWAMLSIRKSAGRNKVVANFKAPVLDKSVRFSGESASFIPESRGVFLLSEVNRPLYAKATINLRTGIDAIRKPETIKMMASDVFWEPDIDSLVVRYGIIAPKRSLKAVEQSLIENNRPLFNISRRNTAA